MNNTNKRTSIFDHETIVCRTCYVAEQLAKTSKDKETRDVVHFAHIIKTLVFGKVLFYNTQTKRLNLQVLLEANGH